MKNLSSQYQDQYNWRDWQTVYKALPDLSQQVILDLGCAIGDQTYALTQRGAKVVGIDNNQNLLDIAIKRQIPNATFIKSNLNTLNSLSLDQVDGIWSSFTIAYFPNLRKLLEDCLYLLRPGGWIAFTEMSGLFDHEPLNLEHKDSIHTYYQYMRENEWYDFQMGENLKNQIKSLPLKIEKHLQIRDDELSFQGPASPDIYSAWEHRLSRMEGLKHFLGDKFQRFNDDFLSCIQSDKHHSSCKVHFYLLKKNLNVYEDRTTL